MSRPKPKDRPKSSPKLVDDRLVATLRHPVRMYAMSVLTDRTMSPAEIGRELDLPARNVAYHIEKLQDLGMVELVRTESAADGRTVEHFFRATQRPWFDREAWSAIDGRAEGVTASIMALINRDLAASISAGTFDGKENHISRTPLVLDRQGYGELVDLLGATLVEGVFGIAERAANRIEPGTRTIRTEVVLLQFDLPDPEQEEDDDGGGSVA